MRKTTIISVLLAFGAFTAAPAAAFDSDWRVKAGMLSLENDDSAATSVGLVYAMDFVGIIGAEAEVNTTIADGELGLTGFGTTDYSASQLGGYATLTTPGPIYFKAKAGYVYTDVESGSITRTIGNTTVTATGPNDSDTGIAYGIGAGFFGFELEYTRTEYGDGDVDFISLAYGF